MGVNISGKGVLSGLVSFAIGAAQSFTLLASRVLGFTYVPGGGSSYYTTTVGSTGPMYIGADYGGGLAAYSEDGITWQLGTSQKQSGITDSAYGNGVFVIGGVYASRMAYSTDGINWELTDAPTQSPGYVGPVYGNGVFVAVKAGFGAYPVYSTDGKTWTSSSADLGIYTNTGIYFINNTFVYIDADGKVSYSVDGITWSFSQLPSNASGFRDLSYGNGKFVIVDGYDFRIAYSSDLTSWTVVDQLPSSSSQLKYGNGLFVGVNDEGMTMYSSDAITWTAGNSSESIGSQVNQLTYGNGVFVCRTNYREILHSSDGSSWTLVQLEGIGSDNIEIHYINNTFFAGSIQLGKLWKSQDAATWTLVATLTGAQWNTMNYGIVSTLKEVQVSIGNQGEEGAEILAPVDVYVVPSGKITEINEVTIKNNSLNPITYDLSVLPAGVSLTDGNALINDSVITAGSTATVNNITTPLTPGQRVVVLPSAVDVVEVKVYGTEI